MKTLKKVSENVWEIPKQGKMNVPGIVYASDKLIEAIKQDETLEQVRNVAMLPGILKASYALPDCHQGYGMSIGGVAAFDLGKGGISPGMCGFDINCGIRALATNIPLKDFIKQKKKVLHDFKRTIPSGVGRGHKQRLTEEELNSILVKGAEWAIEKGFGVKEDLENCEEFGKMSGANPADVSQRAKSRGMPQSGTLGAGNHFLEIQKVDEIYDKEVAKKFGIEKDSVLIMIHCGSRGLGHQVASDYMRLIEDEYGFPEQDRELANAPIKSKLGKKYYSAMKCAVNFAFCNRQLIMNYVREVLKRHFPNSKNHLIYDVCHNISKLEKHKINGKEKEILIVRKGATRSFPGLPVIIPGSMGTASYLLIGTEKAEELSWGSTAHGAGRVMGRGQAHRQFRGEQIKKELNAKGIEVEAGNFHGLVEEAPQVYKDIDEVVDVSDSLGLAKKVARLVPLGVMKG